MNLGVPAVGAISEVEMYALGLVGGPQKFGCDAEPIAAKLQHEQRRGTNLDIYRTLFGCLPQFGADKNEWIVPRRVLDRPMPRRNRGLIGFFEEHLDRRETVANESVRRVESGRRQLVGRLGEIGEDR